MENLAAAQATPEFNLRAVLAMHGIEQREIGREANLSRSTMSRLVVHNVWPRRGTAEARRRVFDALAARGVDIDTLAALQAIPPKNLAPAGSHPAEASLATPAAAHPSDEPQEDLMLLRNEPLTLEARQHFGLSRSPFQDDINSRADVFQSPTTRVARAALMDAAMNHGFIALTGESGAGKSTLREELEQRILDEGRPVIVIKPYILEMEPTDKTGRAMKSGQIAEAIITTLAPNVTMKSSAQARARQAHELLANSVGAGNSHLLIIEEAHRLPLATLKHLKGFMELKRGLQRLLGVALIGQPELRSILSENDPKIREIVQRCELIELAPLDNDLEAYLKHKFTRAGGDMAEVFADDALDAIRARLVRIPRGGSAREAVSLCHPLVVGNLVCRAMNAAAAYAMPRVNAQVVEGC